VREFAEEVTQHACEPLGPSLDVLHKVYLIALHSRSKTMQLLDLMAYEFDAPSAIRKALDRWAPSKLETEKQYEGSLYAFLHKEFDSPSINISIQFGAGRNKADIRIGDSATIELEKDLNSAAQYERLVGQIEQYRKWKGKIFIVLVGKSKPNLTKKLIQEGKGDDFSDEKFIVIEK
jgi:hypothetical protein